MMLSVNAPASVKNSQVDRQGVVIKLLVLVYECQVITIRQRIRMIVAVRLARFLKTRHVHGQRFVITVEVLQAAGYSVDR